MSIAIVDTTDIADGLAVLEKIKPQLEALAFRAMASESTQDLVNDQLHTIALEIALEKRLERTAVAQIHEAIIELFETEYYKGEPIPPTANSPLVEAEAVEAEEMEEDVEEWKWATLREVAMPELEDEEFEEVLIELQKYIGAGAKKVGETKMEPGEAFSLFRHFLEAAKVETTKRKAAGTGQAIVFVRDAEGNVQLVDPADRVEYEREEKPLDSAP